MNEAATLLERGEEKLDSARLLYREEAYEDAVSRAYYAMFHAAKALLVLEDSAPRTHSGVASELGKLYRDRIDTELLSRFSTLQGLREDADYGVDADIGKVEAEDAVEVAETFLERAHGLVEGSG